MTITHEERFERFRLRGDARALGDLFDRTNGELLGLALHLCGHPADAEDALQATFVTAIDRAATYDAARPLMPWLCGILTVHCRRIGERRARRRETALQDGDSGGEAAADDLPPVQAAEHAELVAALRRHAGRLPEEQRQVVLLQLEHGLLPSQVAEVLGVPPGTVRMRLHRAIQALRRLLPAGLVVAFGALLAPRGIAAVRAAVVRHAATVAATTAGTGVVLLKKVLIAAGVFLLLAVAVAIAPWRPDSGPTLPIGAVEPAAASVPSPEQPPGMQPGPGERTRLAADAAGEPAPAATPAMGSLLVELRYRATAQPVPNLPIRVTPVGGDIEARLAWQVAASDGEGRRLFDAVPPGEVRIDIVGCYRGAATVRPGEMATATLELEAGLTPLLLVCGQVVHADGRPAAGATIVVGKTSIDCAVAVGEADSGGRFVVPLVRTAVLVGARHAGFAPSTLCSFQPEERVQLVLPGPGSVLEGSIVDADGAVLAFADVLVGAPNHSQQWTEPGGLLVESAPPQHLKSDAEGRFRAEDLPAGEYVVEIRAGGCAPFWGTAVGVAGAVTARRFELARGFELVGRVVDTAGAAVHGATVGIGRTWSEGRRTTDREGRFGFRNLAAPATLLTVTGDGFDDVVASRDAAATGEWVVTVEPGRRYLLRCVDESGVPLVGWSVELQGDHAPVRAGHTDDCGRVSAVVPGEPRTLRIAPPGCIHTCVECALPPALAQGREETIVVARSARPMASVHGRVVTADGEPLADGAYEILRGDTYLYRGALDHGVVRRDGLPDGDLVLLVHRKEYGKAGGRFAVSGLGHEELRELGDLRLPADGELRLHVVHATGASPRDVSVFLFDAAGQELHAPPCDACAHPWPVGDYTFRVLADDALWESGAFAVRAGEPTVVDVVLRPGVRRRVEFPSPVPDWGSPTHVAYRLRGPDGGVYDHGEFDPREELPFGYAPTLAPGHWRVELEVDDGRRFAGGFDIASFARVPDAIRVAVRPD